jgi:uncharacterized repeat protein (TIGR01451 family)
LTTLFFGVLLIAAGFLTAVPRVQAQAVTPPACQPFDVSFVMDNSGSMDDNGSDTVLFNKLLPRFEMMFEQGIGNSPMSSSIDSELVTFSYNAGTHTPVNFTEENSTNRALRRINSLDFGADGSEIKAGIRTASDNARARYESKKRLQVIIVAGDEQTDTLDRVRDRLHEDKVWPAPISTTFGSSSTTIDQPAGIRYYTFALNNDNANRYKEIATLTGGSFYPKAAGNPNATTEPDGLGYKAFYDQLMSDVCTNFKISIDGKVYNSENQAGLNWPVAVYEEGVATPKIISTDANGFYHARDLSPVKKYRIVPTAQPGWEATTAADTFAIPMERQVRDFGYKYVPPTNCLDFRFTPPGDYKVGDTFTVAAQVTNRSPRADKVRFTIPALSGVRYLGDNQIASPGSASSVLQADGSRIMTSTADISAGFTKTFYWRYQVEENAPLGDQFLTVKAKLLNCALETPGTVRIGIFARPTYDVSVTFDPTSRTIAKDDTGVSYAMTVQNNSPSSAMNLSTTNTILVPKGLTLQSLGKPTLTWSVTSFDATRNKIVWTDSMPSSQTILYQLQFATTLSATGSPYTIQADVQFSDVGADASDVNRTNNTSTAQLVVVSLSVTKVWATGGTETRSVGPTTGMNFKVTLTNGSGSPATNQYVVDYDSVVCDTAYPASCGQNGQFVSDKSVNWTNISGNPKTLADRIVWGPFTVPANSSVTYDVIGGTVNATSLFQKVTTYGPQNRCNTFGLSDTNGVPTGPATSVCWKYDLPTDLAVTKTFSNGAKTATLKQGEVDSFIISVKNIGNNPAINTTLTDTMSESPTTADPFIAWRNGSVEATGGTELSDKKAQWQLGQVAVNETKTIRPGIVVIACNDGSTPISGPTRSFTNLAIATTDARDVNPVNNHNNNDVSATIIGGYYNLALTSKVDRTEVVRSEPGNDTVKITFEVSNLDKTGANEPKVNMSIPGVTLRATLPVDQFDLTLSDGGQIVNGKAVWNVGDVAKGQNVTRTATMKVKSTTSAGDQAYSAEAISLSANSAKTCGYATTDGRVTVKLAGLYTTKSLPLGSDKDIELGKSVTYDISVINNSGVTFTSNLIIADTFTVPMSFDRIESCMLTNDVTKQQLACGVPQVTTNGTTSTWPTLNPLPPRSTVVYRMVAKSDSAYQPTTCPIAVDNAVILRDGTTELHRSAPATINLYASRCFNGNIYAQTSAEGLGVTGVDIRGSDIIIDSNSIVSSKNGIQCTPTNNSCNNLLYKIQGYAVDQAGSAIAFSTLRDRMIRNMNRLERNAEPLPAINGTLDLQKDKVKFPEGRVWKTNGDLTLTTPLKVTGRGTILVNGSLRIVGSGTIEYCDAGFANCTTDSRSGNALGFIVKNNISIGDRVTKMVGAYSAPNGNLTFEGSATSPQLRPAVGMFIANSLTMNRQKIVILYDAFLNTPQGAPPGFSFTASPSETQEGS